MYTMYGSEADVLVLCDVKAFCAARGSTRFLNMAVLGTLHACGMQVNVWWMSICDVCARGMYGCAPYRDCIHVCMLHKKRRAYVYTCIHAYLDR
jgi:hypothetical protein